MSKNDPEYMTGVMEKMVATEGWQILHEELVNYRNRMINRVMEPDCPEHEVDYLRGVNWVIRTILDHPMKVIEECRKMVDEADKQSELPPRPRRRNVPRGL